MPPAPRVAAALAAGCVAVGALLYVAQQRHHLRAGAEEALAAIADAKVQQIAAWRAERLADARSISAHPIVARAVSQLASGRDAARARADLEAWCASRMRRPEYVAVALLDPRGGLLVAVGTDPALMRDADLEAAARSGEVALSDIHADAAGAEHADVYAPLTLRDGGGARPVGMAVLRVDLAVALLPLLETTADRPLVRTVLARRDGASPPVVGGGPEPRGAPRLLSVTRPVPGTPWTLVATVDRRVVDVPLRERAVWAILLGIAFVAVIAAAAALWWRERVAAERRAGYEATLARLTLERELEILTGDTNDILLLVGADGRIVNANARAAAAYRRERSALVGENLRALLDPAAAADLERHLRVLEGGEGHAFEMSHVRVDGESFPVEVRARSIDAGGELLHQLVIRDLSEHRRAEEALRDSEAKFRAAFLEAGVGTALVDPQGRFLEFNPALARMLGYPAEELRLLRFQDLLHPDDREESVAAFGLLLRGERDHNDMERRYVRRDGTVLYARYSTSAIRGERGELRYVMGIVEDVTDKVRAAAALRASEERLRLALEATDEAVWDWDVATDAVHLSPRFSSMLAYAPGDVATMQGALALVHPDDLGRVQAILAANASGTASSADVEHRIRTGRGEWKWVRTRGKVVARDASGAPVRAVGAVADVDEKKKLHASLQQADRLAAVGTLAAGVAHEVNTPLAYVLSNLSFARESLARLAGAPGAAPPADAAATAQETSRALDDALEGVEKVRVIVHDLRTFSRTDDARSPLDVTRVLDSALHLARADIVCRATLRTDLAPVPLVDANESRLGQVFLNLLVNAMQALPEAPAREQEIRVATRAERGRVVVEVADTGCGIPPALLQRIFDPFFTTKPAGVGTGLGLAICHEIVSGMGGRIEVDSQVGLGSVFRVVLPASGA